MSKAEQFIKDYTRGCSNELVFEDGSGAHVYENWLTPDQALSAVAYAREEVIDKACEWIKEIYNRHYIMRYSDSCETSLNELAEWFRNYMKEE